MSSIDKRIVEMKFDNKEFEAGIQASLKSLENLRKGLDLKGATDGIKNIEKAVSGFDMSGMSKSIDSIAQHFTWVGRTIDHTLDAITNKAIYVGKQLVTSLTIDQVNVGWSKFEEKTRSVGTIMSSTGKSVDEVNTSLEKLNWFTDETSYNFTDMVNNVGKFTSVGVDLDDAVTAMEGIANAAALAGGGVGEASRAMYNFSQAMGTGKLLLQDWKSIELANMATIDFKNSLIESGLAMGTLVKQGNKYVTTTKDGTGAISSFTDANEGFRDSLSAGWITTEVMMDTFKKYGEYADEIYKITESEGITAAEAMERFSSGTVTLGERAFKAAQEARTFTDAIEATKDAVSTGWMQSFEIIFGNYEQAKVMWTDLANTLWDVFAGGAEARNDLLRETFQEAKNIVSTEDWDKIADDIPFVDTFRKAILDTAKDHGIALENMYTDEAAFYTLLEKGEITTDLLTEALNRVGGSGKDASSGLSGTTEQLEELEKVAKKVIRGDFGNGDKRIKALTEAGYDYKQVQSVVNKLLKGQTITVEDLSEAELKQIGYTEEQIKELNQLKEIAEKTGTPLNQLIDTMNRPTGRELMIESASNAFEALMKIIQSVKDAWADVFPAMTADRLYSIIERVRDFTQSLIVSNDTADKLKRVFRGVFSVFDILGQALSSTVRFFGKLLEILKPTGDWLLSTGAKVGDFWFDLSKNFRELGVFDHIADGLLKVLQTLGRKLKVVKGVIIGQLNASGLLEPIKSTWADFMNWINSKGGIVGLIDSFFNLINEWVSKLDALKIGTSIINFIKGIKDNFKGVSGLKDFIERAFKPIFDFFGSLDLKIGGSLRGGTKSVTDWVISFIKGIKDALGGIGKGIGGAFGSAKDSIVGGFGWLSDAIDSVTSFIKEKISPVLSLIKDILLLKTLSSINKFIGGLGKTFESVSDIISNASQILEDFRGILKDWAKGIEKMMSAKSRELNANAVLKVAESIVILVGALWILSKIDPDTVYDSISILAVLMGGLLLFTKSLGSGGKTEVKISGFLGLAMGVFVLVKTMQSIAKMDIKEVIKSMGEVGALLLILSKFTNLTDSTFKASNGAALLLTAISLQGFVLTMVELSNMDPGKAIGGMIALGFLLAEVGGFTRLVNKDLKFRNGAALLMIGISLQTFVLAMIELAHMKPENAVKGILGLGVLLTEVGLFTKKMGKDLKFSSGASLIAIGASMLIFGQAMKQIGSLDFGTIIKGLVGMGAALLEISIFTKSSSNMGISSGIGTAVSMASLLVLIPLFKELSKLPNMEKVGIGFGAGIAGIGIGLQALSKVGGIAGALSASGALLTISGTIGIIITVVEVVAGLVAKIKGSREFLEGAADILSLVGGAIGAFIGSIGTGIMAGVGAGLAAIGQGLSDFWNSASVFIEGAKTIKAEDMGGIGALSEAVLKLTASEFLDAVTSLIGGGEKNLETFGAQLKTLGGNLSSFSDEAKKVDQKAVEAAAAALQAITNVEVPESGGLLQALIGEKNYGNFGRQLGSLGTGLSDFMTSVQGIENFNKIKDAAGAIADLVAVEIPTTGGFIDYIVGRTDWGVFGEQLAAFGPNFAQFATDVNGVEVKGLAGAAEALGVLLSINPPTTDWGLIQIFTGTTNWGKFGTQLQQFGAGFQRFAKAMKGVTEADLDIIPTAVTTLQDLMDLDPPKQGGFFQMLVGEKDLGTFGDNIGKLGKGFGTFNTNVKEVNVVRISNLTTILERLGNFLNSLSNGVIDNVSNFITALSLIDSGNLTFEETIKSINGWQTQFADSGKALATACVKQITDTISKATTPIESIEHILNGMLTTIGNYNQRFETRGGTLISNVVYGMNKYKTNVTNAAGNLAVKALDTLNGYGEYFKSSGAYLAQGFVYGLGSKANAVVAAARSLADVANYAFNRRLQIRSPSRVTMRSGEYFDQGFVIGLQNRSKDVENASGDVAYSAIDSFTTAMTLIEGILKNSVDFQPTIRPVVDLSNVEYGANQISSIFSQDQTIGLGGYQNPFIPRIISQISSNMGNQDTGTMYVDNSDVIEAIRDLGDEFETIKNAIAQMRIVMNRDALVGEIIDKVDSELGRIASIKNRRI